MRVKRDGDEGSTLILTIFYGALALVIILVVAAITSLYLERKQLQSIADAASLVGAEAFSLSAAQTDQEGVTVALASADVHDEVSEFISDSAFDPVEGLTLENATSVDGRSATVTVSGWWRPPVLTLFVPDGFRIEATSVARSVFAD
ncbi:pilus assembly protein TadG-related protein [Paramicrobacterium sp. CJ85]|uniref:pilus assembly protein TadG-related protein n=1 Tax=Paramicrobacterium sp. CJ85 TaxID=3445355 RepID=UPI003F62419E